VAVYEYLSEVVQVALSAPHETPANIRGIFSYMLNIKQLQQMELPGQYCIHVETLFHQ
jgi:hypothetical protein